MGWKKEIPPETRAAELSLAEYDVKQKEIALRTVIHADSVHRIVRKHKNDEAQSNRGNCVRVVIFGARMVKRIHGEAVANPFIVAREIQANFEADGARTPSVRTVRRILCNQRNLPSRRPAKKPLLSVRQHQAAEFLHRA